jgi:carbon monoxide dehydrogenase subunit G
MKLSTREDIEAPLDIVFAGVSDFAAFERRALREGASVLRHDAGPVKVGSVWDIAVPFRGRERRFTATLTALEPSDSYMVTTEADGLVFTTQVELVALSRSRTRVSVVIDITARTITARLLVQSLKLAKARLTERFRARVRDYADRIGDDYRKQG